VDEKRFTEDQLPRGSLLPISQAQNGVAFLSNFLLEMKNFALKGYQEAKGMSFSLSLQLPKGISILSRVQSSEWGNNPF
jgi:hypothetical protein